MPLSIAEVKHLAELARLELSAAEVERYCRELGSILDYVATLQQLTVPAGTDVRLAAELRADEVRPWQNPEELIEQAPTHDQNYVTAPAVFEDRE